VKDGRGALPARRGGHSIPPSTTRTWGWPFRYPGKGAAVDEWILSLLGFDGDSRGLASLKLAKDRGVKTEAALFYAQFMFSEEKHTALIYLGQLREAS
jgi:hypothetical protein